MTATPFVRHSTAALAGLLALTLLAAPAVSFAAASQPAPQSAPQPQQQGQPASPAPPGQGQPAPTPPPAAPSAPPSAAPSAPNAAPPVPSENLTPAELNRLFEAYAVLQAQSMLRLTDDQYADFIMRLRALQNVRRRHQQARQRLVQDLRKLTNPQNLTPDEAAIKTTMETLTRADATAYEEIRQATEQVDELLDIRQRARFRVFEDNLERWKLDLLSRVRRPARNKPRLPKS